MTASKRKGWRKGKSFEGRMRLADTYSNKRLDLTVQLDGARGWFYSGGNAGNSLWLTPPAYFTDPVEAMKAAEAAHDKGGA